jgi:peroxiredoxin-like protein
MNTTYTYHADVVWSGERRGVLRSAGMPEIQVAAPPEFKGHEGAWTPEHLFVSSVATCFVTTFLAIAELSKLEFDAIEAAAVGTLEKVEGRGFLITEVVIRPRLVVTNAGDTDRALRILDKAERNCLISNSINASVRLEPHVVAARPSGEPETDAVEA